MRLDAKASTAGSTKRLPGRLIPAATLTTLLGLIALLSIGASTAAAADCPNEIRRQEQGVAALRLPDCRAYENASPGGAPRAGASQGARGLQIAPSGDALGFHTVYPPIGQEHSGQFYRSVRGAGGWSLENAVPQESPEAKGINCGAYVFFSRTLTKNVLQDDRKIYNPSSGQKKEGYCNAHEEVLDPEEVKGIKSLFLRDIPTDSYQLVSSTEAAEPDGNSEFRAASDDLDTIAFESESLLTADAPDIPAFGEKPREPNVFVWSGGTVRLATYLPDGTPVRGTLPVGNGYNYSNVLARDGSVLFFIYEGDLYARTNPGEEQSALSGEECTEAAKACTVQIDESEGPGASGAGEFEMATPDGSKVFFTGDSKLTGDSTAEAGDADLYEYDFASGELTDLTVDGSEAAGVRAASAASTDASYVYFVAEAVLEGSGATLPGDCATNSEGHCNLYVLHEGVTTYIASLSVDDAFANNGSRAQASPSGRFFAFETTEDLGEGTGIHLYDADTDALSCVCFGDIDPVDQYGSGTSPVSSAGWRKNQVLDDGSVYFDTTTALVAADVNEGVRDVYRYKDGEYHIITTGKAEARSDLLNVTPDGSSVFFSTPEDIVRSDTEGGLTIYAARVGGGFPEPPPLPGCEGEACRGGGTDAPDAAATGSAAFLGAGNLKQSHKRNCGIVAKRAQRLSRNAKRLRRRARRTNNARRSKRLRKRANRFAKKGKQVSRNAKRCRRANRRASK